MASLGGEQIISSKDITDNTSHKENRPNSADKKSFMEYSNSTIHWFAQIGDDNNSDSNEASRDREEKLRLIRERQNEERQRKIEELKAQAEAAQKYREQKEEERRRRMEELRNRDNDRRQQVEERKRAILEAEKERKEYILRRNQEREARLDTKRRNEKSSITFAFGSSTPRLLDPSDLGNVSPSTFWGHRRSTSITNVAYTGAPLSRRSSERELSDGSKKRATSAGGIDRQNEEETTDSAAISYRSVYRRKTDLMPTIPSPREPSFGSKSSLHSQAHTPKTPGSRSGEVTPKGSNNPSRPGSAMSTSTTASGFVQKRNTTTPRKPRPASIAITGVSLNDEQKQKKDKPPLPKIQSTPKRSSGNHISSKATDSVSRSNERKSATKRDITPQKLMSTSMTQSIEQRIMKTVKEKQPAEKSSIEKMICENDNETKQQTNLQISNETVPPQTKEEKDALNTVKTEINTSVASVVNNGSVDSMKQEKTEIVIDSNVEVVQNIMEQQTQQVQEQPTEKIDDGTEKETSKKDEKENMEKSRELSVERQEMNDMTASMIARSKITTEEEAKAALAERRRIAKEKADREAELERQRLEAEHQAKLKKQAEEEEKQREFEKEALLLAKAQRKAEEERLLQAIEDAKKRELEEKLKREEEERLKAEKEENERKAKEEAEKQRVEMVERLKREEKEREERRKRVEAIMSRTRARGGNPTPNSTPVKENESSKEQDSNNGKAETTSEMKSNDETSTNNSQISKENTDKVNVEKNIFSEEQQNILEHQQIEPQLQLQQQQHKQLYEQSVTEKENSLMKSFSNLIIDENVKNIHPNAVQIQNPFMMMDMTNGKMMQPIQAQLSPQQNNPFNDFIPNHPIANGNGHIENNLNQNDTNSLIDVSSTTSSNSITLTTADQLLDFSNNESQQQLQYPHHHQEQQQQLIDVVNFTNNNSLLTTTSNTTTLVTADSHENKEISLL